MKIFKSKVVALVLTLTMVISMIAAPIVSATGLTVTTDEAAEFLASVGVLEGDNGDLMLDKELTRQDAVVLLSRLLGVEAEASTYPTDGMTFGDIIDDYYAPYIAWAQDNQLVEGYSEETFGYGDFLTAWQTKALMVRALGYTTTSDEEIDEMADLLGVSSGSTAESNSPITRADMALLAFNTVHAETIDNVVLGESLGILEPAEAPVLSDVKASANTTAAKAVTITGKVAPATATVSVGAEEAEVAEDGTFSIEVSLEEGENTFDVVAKNGYKTVVEEVAVTRVAGYEFEAKLVKENTVDVTFSAAVPETDEVKFELKGKAAVKLAVKWNEDATVASLVAPGALLEGGYTLTIEGLDFVNGKNTANILVIKNGVATIEILSENLVIEKAWNTTDKETVAVVYYKLLDRYGVDITKDVVSKSDLDVATSKSMKSTSGYTIDSEKGKLTITYDVELEEDDKVALTLIASKTGAAKSATLTVVEEAQIAEIKIIGLEFEDEDDVKLLTEGDNEDDAYIILEAFDQYGNEVTDPDAFDTANNSSTAEVLYVISNSNVTLTEDDYEDDDENDKVRLIIDTTNLTTPREVTVHIVSKLTGNRDSITLDIKEASAPAEVKIGAQEQVVAANDKEEGLIIPIYVYDQDGVQLTADEVVSAYDDQTLKVEGSGILNGKLGICDSGENKGKIVNLVELPGNKESTAVITLTAISDSKSDVDTYTIDIEEPYYEKEIETDKKPAQNLLMGAVTKMNVQFTDQYGRDIDVEDVSSNTLVTIEVSDDDKLAVAVAGSETDADGVIYTTAAKVAEEDSIVITTAGTKEGSARVTIKLYRVDEDLEDEALVLADLFDDIGALKIEDFNVIDKVEESLNVTKGVPGDLTFEVEDIPTLVYNKVASDTALAGAHAYARPIKVIAKDGSGKTYAIPSDRILSVAVEGKYLMATQAPVGNATIDKQDNERLVAAAEIIDEFNLTTAKESDVIKTNISVAVSTDKGVKNVVKEVTISNMPAKVVKVVFTDTEIPAKNPYALAEDAKEVDSITGLYDSVIAKDVYVYVVDQYGVYTQANITASGTDLEDVVYVVSNKDRFTGVLGYDGENFAFNKAQVLEDEDVFVMFQSLNSGAYNTIKLRVSDSGADKLDKTPPAVTGITNNAFVNDDVVITFTDASGATATLAKGADAPAAFTSGSTVSAEGTYVLVVTDAATNVTTINFVIDKTAPVVPADANIVKNDGGITGNADAVEANVIVKIYADGADIATAIPVKTVIAGADGSFAKQVLANGAYDVYAVDAAGNVSDKLDVTVSAD